MSETIYMPRPHMALRLLYLAVVVSALPPAFVIAWCIMAWRFGCALHDDFVEMKHRML
jgi:hypothetical protein